VYRTISSPIVAKCLPVNFGIQFAPTALSNTASRQPPTCSWMAKLSSRSKEWSSTSERFGTTSRTTGSNCYRWRSLPTTTPSTIPRWWHPAGWFTIAIILCSLSLPRTPVSDHRCWLTGGWQRLKRLIKFGWKTWSGLRSERQSTPAEKRWLLRLEAKYSYQPVTWTHPGHQRSSITSAQDRIR